MGVFYHWRDIIIIILILRDIGFQYGHTAQAMRNSITIRNMVFQFKYVGHDL